MIAAESFDDDLLQDYMDGFYGYGNYAADYWFVGMEEGSTGTFEEIALRLRQWDQRGRNELEDVVDYHAWTGNPRLFGPDAKIQPTWGGLIKIILSTEHQSLDRERVRRFQREQLGRAHG